MLKEDAQFKAVVEEMRKLPENQRKEVLARARRVCQPTWAEMGYIDKEGNGQTEAGQQAQLLISAAIVDSIEAMLRAQK